MGGYINANLSFLSTIYVSFFFMNHNNKKIIITVVFHVFATLLKAKSLN